MDEPICSVDRCGKPVRTKGLCSVHYQRVWRLGTVDLPFRETCRACGGGLPPKRGPGPTPSYCSEPCRGRAYYLAAKTEGRLYRPPPKPKRRTDCISCGVEFEVYRGQRCCSRICTNAARDQVAPTCLETDCLRPIRAKGLCVYHWNKKARADGRMALPKWSEARKARSQLRVALKKTTARPGEVIRMSEVAERDDWLCGICLLPVDPDLAHPDPGSASLDHVTPLSLGGAHRMENVQLSHLKCNVQKGARPAA